MMRTEIIGLLKNEEAVSAVEYALILGLIALAIVVSITALGGGISTMFNRLVTIIVGL